MLARALIVHEHRGEASASSHMIHCAFMCHGERLAPFYHASHYNEGLRYPMRRNQRAPDHSLTATHCGVAGCVYNDCAQCGLPPGVIAPQWH